MRLGIRKEFRLCLIIFCMSDQFSVRLGGSNVVILYLIICHARLSERCAVCGCQVRPSYLQGLLAGKRCLWLIICRISLVVYETCWQIWGPFVTALSDPIVCRTCWQKGGQFMTVFHVRSDCLWDFQAGVSACDSFPCQTQLSTELTGIEGVSL